MHRQTRSRSPRGRFGGGSWGFGSQRIDRHECRRKAVEFLTQWDDSRSYSEAEVDRVIARFVRQRPNGWDSLSYAAEILYGLLGPKRGLLIADRWIMGILAEDIQKTLQPGELSVLRWAAFELLNHPHIPTTVIINEANNIAKMFCPQAASLVHVAVNRMIETQQTIGAEVLNGALPILPIRGSGEPGKEEEKKRYPDLDPQAQLALMLLDQQRKMRKLTPKDDEELLWLEPSALHVGKTQATYLPSTTDDLPRELTRPSHTQLRRMVEAVRKNETTQTQSAKTIVQV